jgi:hypothetical protein
LQWEKKEDESRFPVRRRVEFDMKVVKDIRTKEKKEEKGEIRLSRALIEQIADVKKEETIDNKNRLRRSNGKENITPLQEKS